MTDPVISKPVLVSTNQGILDVITAGMRLMIVILATAPAAILLIKKHDLIGLYDYLHSDQQGLALVGALTGLAALLFGLWKSFKRGSQMATVAADPGVPAEIADIKK